MGRSYYNGMLLPEPPADVWAEYPYAWLREKKNEYELIFSKTRWLYYVSGVLGSGDGAIWCEDNKNQDQPTYFITKSAAASATEWEYLENNKGYSFGDTVRWSSHDMMESNGSGEVIYAGTALVPFVETFINVFTSHVNADASNPISLTDTATLLFTAEEGYELTDTVYVTGASYTWDKSTGTLTLSDPTGGYVGCWLGYAEKYEIELSSLADLAMAVRISYNLNTSLTMSQMADQVLNTRIPKTETKTISPDFSTGDMVVTPTDGSLLSEVTIQKPDTLLPENIALGVNIAGVVGTLEAGTSDDVRYVTFMNGETVLYVKPVAVGDDCVDVLSKGLIETPTKESTAQYSYTYYGWGASDGGAADSTILQNITEDKTVYAIFTAAVRYYTITWLDDDGTTLKTETLAYGSTPSYTPQKDGYIIAGWNPEIASVTGDATYTAIWEESIGGQCGDSAYWNLKDNVLTISGTGALYDYYTSDPPPWSDYRSTITDLSIGSGITSIGNYCFNSLSQITEIYLPDSVTNISASAFYACSNVEHVSVGAYIKTIGSYAFVGLSKIKDSASGIARRATSAATWKSSNGKSFTETYAAGVKECWGLYKLIESTTAWGGASWTRQ